LKFDDINHTVPRLETINECLRTQIPISPAHSNGKPVVSSTTTNPSVRFASILRVVPVFDETALVINHVPLIKKVLKQL
jgi:hypothetical protein